MNDKLFNNGRGVFYDCNLIDKIWKINFINYIEGI
jgi:hypothetical protein